MSSWVTFCLCLGVRSTHHHCYELLGYILAGKSFYVLSSLLNPHEGNFCILTFTFILQTKCKFYKMKIIYFVLWINNYQLYLTWYLGEDWEGSGDACADPAGRHHRPRRCHRWVWRQGQATGVYSIQPITVFHGRHVTSVLTNRVASCHRWVWRQGQATGVYSFQPIAVFVRVTWHWFFQIE